MPVAGPIAGPGGGQPGGGRFADGQLEGDELAVELPLTAVDSKRKPVFSRGMTPPRPRTADGPAGLFLDDVALTLPAASPAKYAN